jgi:putative ABC transport system substrate-binding protein
VNRRAFIAGTLVVFARPLTAPAQGPTTVLRIGLLGPASPEDAQPFVAVFLQRMREHDWIQGANIVLDGRWAGGKVERMPELAQDLVRSKVVVIVAWTTPGAKAAKRATSTIPIVMVGSGDAVGTGLVASLSRPGGNVTGVSFLQSETIQKHAELLREVFPRISRIGVLFDPTSASDVLARRAIHASAANLGLLDESFPAESSGDIAAAFVAIRQKRVEALVVLAGGVNWVNRRRIFELAATGRVAAIYQHGNLTREGGLMSYGVDLFDLTRQAADYVDKILRGKTPAELPVEQPTKFELVINLKTARALDITIPPSLLARADEVIE